MHNRRSFLKTVAAAAAACSLPRWYLNDMAQAAPDDVADDRPAVALVGCGGMGRGDARNAARYGRIVAVCDVDDRRKETCHSTNANAWNGAVLDPKG